MNRTLLIRLIGLSVAIIGMGISIAGESEPSTATKQASSASASSSMPDRAIQERLAILMKMNPKTEEVQHEIYLLQGQLLSNSSPLLDSGNLKLKGKIVDEDGKVMDNVAVSIVRTKAIKLGWENENKEERLSVKEEFIIEAKDINGLTLRFRKTGYYDREIFLPINNSKETSRLLSQLPKIAMSDKSDGVAIVLDKKGKLTELSKRSNVNLIYKAGGSGIGADVLGDGKYKSTTIKNLEKKETMIAHAVYVRAEQDSKGALAVVDQNQNAPGKFFYPVKLYITTSDEKDGFVKFICAQQGTHERQMRHAPVDGYKQEIEFSADELRRNLSKGEGDCCFYFRLSGKYGRAVIYVADITRDDGKTLNTSVVFEVQPDGSRNLETGE